MCCRDYEAGGFHAGISMQVTADWFRLSVAMTPPGLHHVLYISLSMHFSVRLVLATLALVKLMWLLRVIC